MTNTENSQILIRKMMCINRMHRSVIEKKVSELGLHRSQHMVLMYLARHNEGVSQKEIAEHFDISSAAVAVTLKKLENGGYIERSSAQDDSRKNSVSFTAKGKEIAEKSRKFFAEVDGAMTKTLSDEEYEIINNCFEKMKKCLSEYDS